MLHCLTEDPQYLDIARKLQMTLSKHNRAECGFASIADVNTGVGFMWGGAGGKVAGSAE